MTPPRRPPVPGVYDAPATRALSSLAPDLHDTEALDPAESPRALARLIHARLVVAALETRVLTPEGDAPETAPAYARWSVPRQNLPALAVVALFLCGACSSRPRRDVVVAAGDGGPPTTEIVEGGDALCGNGLDDDGDGAADCSDRGCLTAPVCAPNPRPLDTPDVLIVAVSGHCNPFRCFTSYNDEYLNSGGTLRAIAAPFLDRGLQVSSLAATDNFYDEPVGAETPAAYGFLSLLARLEWVRDNLVADWDDPTRIVVVGHSHGTVWAHLALHVLEQEGSPVPVDVLVDLDAVSEGWEDKVSLGFGDAWGSVIQDYTSRTGTVWPFEIWNSADSWVVPGDAGLLDIEDIVPDSVTVNLEVWSSDGTAIRDRDPNIRLDGSTTGFARIQSVENHEGTVEPGSDSIEWVTEAITAAYDW